MTWDGITAHHLLYWNMQSITHFGKQHQSNVLCVHHNPDQDKDISEEQIFVSMFFIKIRIHCLTLVHFIKLRPPTLTNLLPFNNKYIFLGKK